MIATLRGLVLGMAAAALLWPGHAAAEDPQQLVDKARITVETLTEIEQMATVKQLMAESKGVMVVPQMLRGGFIVGAAGGSGVLLSRDAKTGRWSSPAFYTLGSGSIGLQIGAEASEVLLLIMTEEGLQAVINDQFRLGADASVAVGPVGAGVQASTTSNMSADIYSFQISKGLYGGVALEGGVISARDDWNQEYYGKTAEAKAIVLERRFTHPGARQLQTALTNFAK